MSNFFHLREWTKNNIKARHQRIIKILHLFFACLWGGSTVSVTLMQCLFRSKNLDELYVSSMLSAYVDSYIVAPSAVGCLLTGLAYASLTNFGFFKYKWIIVKWCITVAFLAFGFLWYAPWLDRLISYGKEMASQAFLPTEAMPIYIMRIAMDIVQLLILFAIVCISVIKPWGRVKSKMNINRQQCDDENDECTNRFGIGQASPSPKMEFVRIQRRFSGY